MDQIHRIPTKNAFILTENQTKSKKKRITNKQASNQQQHQAKSIDLLSLPPFKKINTILPLYYYKLYLYMCTAADSVKGPQERAAGAVETFLKHL